MLLHVAPWVVLIFLVPPAWQAPPTVTNPQRLKGDRVFENEGLFEGDIHLPEGQSEDRGVVTRDARLWPEGVIPYVINTRHAGDIKKIRDGMRSIEAVSCLRFVNRTTEKDYIFIERQHDGCSSYIGRQGGAQQLNLSNGCLAKSIVMHELLHAAGFYHEQTRSDRDHYVVIYPENVEKGKFHNFKKRKPSENRLLTPFDIQSVMFYGSESFSRAPGLVTILSNRGKRLPEVWQKKELSVSDARRIRILYKC